MQIERQGRLGLITIGIWMGIGASLPIAVLGVGVGYFVDSLLASAFNEPAPRDPASIVEVSDVQAIERGDGLLVSAVMRNASEEVIEFDAAAFVSSPSGVQLDYCAREDLVRLFGGSELRVPLRCSDEPQWRPQDEVAISVQLYSLYDEYLLTGD
jgi:hypothetical protein